MSVPVLKLHGYHNPPHQHYHHHNHHHNHQHMRLGVSYPPHTQRIPTVFTACINASSSSSSFSSSEYENPLSNPPVATSGLETTYDELLHPSPTITFPSISPPQSSLDSSLSLQWVQQAENGIEKAIFNFRFLSLLAVIGSLAGSFLCFLKGCVYIKDSYSAFYIMCTKSIHTGAMLLSLVEAVDVYLTGTVMLIFGMGLYGLFITNIPCDLPPKEDRALRNSSLFGMFLLRKRPKWMRIASLDELKTKLGHVVVMILLVKMFERSKSVLISTSTDLLAYSISIFLISGALLVLRNISHH